MATTATSEKVLNGVDAAALRRLIDNCAADPGNAQTGFSVTTHWRGGAVSETRVEGYEFAGRKLARDFSIWTDEPPELCGSNTRPNPQEVLMAAFNACMMVGYVAGATLHGIELQSLSIETSGRLDLRGFLGLDAKVKPGYDTVHYTVRVKGDGTPEQFRQIHETVIATSPNRFNLASPIKLTSELVID